LSVKVVGVERYGKGIGVLRTNKEHISHPLISAFLSQTTWKKWDEWKRKKISEKGKEGGCEQATQKTIKIITPPM